jgi:hypothetical protein
MVDEEKSATAYLNPDEEIMLDHFGVSVSATSLQFSKKLAQSELRHVWRLVSAIRRRSPKSEDWVNWLIGDWLNETSTRFGPMKAEQIVREEEQLQHYRDHVVRLSGSTLIALQLTEHAVAICCRLLDPKQQELAIDGMFSRDSAKRRRTLGQLCKSLSARGLFIDEFEQRLSHFVADRNRFVHRLWMEDDLLPVNEFSAQLQQLKNLESFILELIRESQEVLSVFTGFYAAIGLAITERDKAEDRHRQIATEWDQDIRKFAEVHRGKPSSGGAA